jgi:hypothetical protein
MKKPTIALSLLGVFVLIILSLFLIKQEQSSLPVRQSQVAPYLNDLVKFLNEGYIADRRAHNTDLNDPTATLASIIEQINHEESAISILSKYSTSSNTIISSTSRILVASERDLIIKKQKVLDLLRQVTEGASASDFHYVFAEFVASQNQRNDNFISALPLFVALTMDLDKIPSNVSSTIAKESPTGALSDSERKGILITLKYTFGSTLDSHENDVFLLLAQNLNAILKSDTYENYYTSWQLLVSLIPPKSK